MVFDTFENCKLYYPLHKNFEKAFDFIKKAVSENYAVGKYEIDSDKVYASVQEYETKDYNDAKFEGHRNYIDIQYIISGIECMEMIDISKAEPNTEYNETKDVMFYKNRDISKKCVVEADEYGIFFPQDIHKPGFSFENQKSKVKKIVVKVKCE